MTPPRVAARGMGVGASLRGASGTPPPTVCPGMSGSGEACPSSGPAGPPSPEGGRQGLLLAAARTSAGRRGRRPLRFARERAVTEGRGGVGAPRPTYGGDMETLWGLREQSFPGRRAVGAGHARPGGWRGQASMVRPVGRGLDPSAGGYRGMGVGTSLRGASGTPPPTVCREWASAGACPSSGPAGPPSPKGEGKGCCWRQREPPPTPAAGPRCGAGGSGCSTSGLTKPAQYQHNLGRCRGGSRR